MAGLFDGFVQENPIFVDNSEKYAKRAEEARDKAIESQHQAALSAQAAKGSEAFVSQSVDEIRATNKVVEELHACTHKDRDEVAGMLSETKVFNQKFEEDKKKVSEDRAEVERLAAQTATHAGQVASDKANVEANKNLAQTAANAADASQKKAATSESNAAKSEATASSKATVATNAANLAVDKADQATIVLEESEAHLESAELFQREVLATRNEVEGMANAADASAKAAEVSNVGSQSWYDKSHELYEELQKGQVYRGTWNPNSGSYPDHKDSNSTWDIILNDGQYEVTFDNQKWYGGDRLVYVKSEGKYQRISSGSSVTSVNGKTGAVTLNAAEVGAVSKAGDTMTGELILEKGLQIHGILANPKFTHANKQLLNAGTTQVYIGNRDGVSELHLQTNNGMAYVNHGQTNHRIYHQGFKPTPADVGALSSRGGKLEGTLEIATSAPVLRLTETDNTNTPYSLVVDGGNVRMNVRTTSSLDEDVVWKWSDASKEFYTPGKLTAKGGLYDGVNRAYSAGNKPTPDALGCIPSSMLPVGSSFDHIAGKIVKLSSGGGMEVGPYIDFHATGSTADFDVRIDCFKSKVMNITADDVQVGGYSVYHRNNKPTASDVGALPITGGTLKGGVAVEGQVRARASSGFQSDRDPNGTAVGLSSESGYVMMWRRNNSDTKADEFLGIDNNSQVRFRMDNNTGDRKYTDHRIYHTGFKPTTTDIGALPITGGALTGSLTAPAVVSEKIDMGPFTVQRSGNKLQFLV